MRNWATAILLTLLCQPTTFGQVEAVVEPSSEVANSSAILEPIVIDRLRVTPMSGSYGRRPIHQDAIESQLISGKLSFSPLGDDKLTDDEVTDDEALPGWSSWDEVVAGARGSFSVAKYVGGYGVATVEAAEEETRILHGSGYAAVYVNGELYAGDPYGTGWLETPIRLRKGSNFLLFHLAASTFAAELKAVSSDAYFLTSDVTKPDRVRGADQELWISVPIINTTDRPMGDLSGTVELVIDQQQEGNQHQAVPIAEIPPRSRGLFVCQAPHPQEERASNYVIRLSIVRKKDRAAETDRGGEDSEAEIEHRLDTCELTINTVDATEKHVRTFVSGVDGSVQPFGLHVASEAKDKSRPLPLIVSLHDKGKTCREQLEAHAPLARAHLVAPQGRRPFGFDWEDWSRADVLEVLDELHQVVSFDKQRTVVAGCGMGGHGAWYLGVTDPDRFAGIFAGNGWASFWSYGGNIAPIDGGEPIASMLARPAAPSDVLQQIGNIRSTAVSILHDPNHRTVHVAQGRLMRSRLGDFHGNFLYAESGPEFDGRGLIRSNRLPAMLDSLMTGGGTNGASESDQIDFVTASPAVSYRRDWVQIVNQQSPLQFSRVAGQRDRGTRLIVLKTVNVERLHLDLSGWRSGQSVRVKIDGSPVEKLPWPRGGILRLLQRGEGWVTVGHDNLQNKHPARSGGFKHLFHQQPLLVYGTRGNSEENQWAFAKARYDAETFAYRGNGRLQLLADRDFNQGEHPQRNVILYGNAETNGAWPQLLSVCPVQMRRGRVSIGLRPEEGDDLGMLLVRPRVDTQRAMVGVVGGTGIRGMRATNRLRYFVSGVHYPDLLLFGDGALERAAEEVRAIGYFGNDWSIESGEIIWRDVAL